MNIRSMQHVVGVSVMFALIVFGVFANVGVASASTVEVKLTCDGGCATTPPAGRTCTSATQNYGEGAPGFGGAGPTKYRTSLTETQVCDGVTKQVRYAVFENVGNDVQTSGGGGGSEIMSALGQALQQGLSKGLEGLTGGGKGQGTCGLTTAAVQAASEEDPRYCSIVVAGPDGCPMITKVSKKLHSPCPDAWASFKGGAGGSQLSQIAGQVLGSVVQGLLGQLMGGGGGGGSADAGSYRQDPTTYDTVLSGTGSDTGYSVTDLLGQNDNSVTDQLNDAVDTVDTVGQMQQAGDAAVQQIQSGVLGNTATNKAPGVFEKFCANRSWENGAVSWLLPGSVFERMCATLVKGGTANTASSFNTGSGVAPAETSYEVVQGEQNSGRGMTCPLYLRNNQVAEISWSCGAGKSLAAVAGFTLDNSSKTSTLVRPAGESGVYGVRCSDDFEDFCTVQVIDPQIMIQAVPNEVRLGSRTMIYWSAEGGIDSCDILGPSFSEHSLRGGAATVPINEKSIFTIQCKILDGSTETRQVSVGLAI